MNRFIIPVLLLLSLCSCNSSQLEWWEVVNTPNKRADRVIWEKNRNNDAEYEKALFETMDNVESSLRWERKDSWVSSGNPFLVGLSILYYILCGVLIVMGIWVLAEGPVNYKESREMALVLGISAILAVGIAIPYSLLVDNATSAHGSVNFMQLILIIGLLICFPITIRLMEEGYWGRWGDLMEEESAPYLVSATAFRFVIPFALILGVFVRKLATFGSYLFLLCIFVEFCIVLYKCIRHKTDIWHSLFSLFYVLFVGVGSVIVFYSAVEALAWLGGWIAAFFFILAGIWGIISDPEGFFNSIGNGSSSSYSSSSSSSSSNSDYYSMDSMSNTYKTDADGDEIFEHRDGRYYKHTWTGWQETEKPD